MFEAKETIQFDADEEDYDTVVANDINFTGTVRFSKPLMVKGKISGQIDATSDLYVDQGAVVSADIVADRVMVKGVVNGNITGRKLVYVAAVGTVKGDIIAPQVVLEPGSNFSGKCQMLVE